ncbi:MAG: hypothetical protein WAM04_09125 [Candidatus Sulfotelmatobacter sp.]
MTIGIGFLCEDGIVLCSDTQITYPANHKYYETKLYRHSGAGWEAAFIYAGNPNLMKSFYGKFGAAMRLVPPPWSCAKIHGVIETLLNEMDVVDSDPDGLQMLCAICVAPDFAFLKTERKIVSLASGMEYIGLGDSSLLRYLAPLLVQTRAHIASQAMMLGNFLVQQAKRYVDGCGGETNGLVLKSDGRATWYTHIDRIEQRFLSLEFALGQVATFLFDGRVTEHEFNGKIDQLTTALKDFRREQIPLVSVAKNK